MHAGSPPIAAACNRVSPRADYQAGIEGESFDERVSLSLALGWQYQWAV